MRSKVLFNGHEIFFSTHTSLPCSRYSLHDHMHGLSSRHNHVQMLMISFLIRAY